MKTIQFTNEEIFDVSLYIISQININTKIESLIKDKETKNQIKENNVELHKLLRKLNY